MATTTKGSEYVRLSRLKKRRERLFSDVSSEMQRKLATDMTFWFRYDGNGLHLEWDWTDATEAFLQLYARDHGMEFDELMAEFNAAIIEREYKRLRGKR